MRTVVWTAFLGIVIQGFLVAQDDMRDMPLTAGVVLDPTGPWQCLSQGTGQTSAATGLSQDAGQVRIVVAYGTHAPVWHRTLHVPFDLRRYPICVLTYRASGLMPSQDPAVEVGRDSMDYLTVARNWDLIADGEVHETMVDLREQDARGMVNALWLRPRVREPDSGVLELHAIRFESNHMQPPVPDVPEGEETEFAVRVVDTEGRPVPEANVTIDAERVNARRSAQTDARGQVTVPGLLNAQGQHSLRIEKEGMAPLELATDEKGEFPETLTLLRGASYGGVVLDEQGKPVPEAEVRIEVRGEESCMGHGGWHARRLTDASGRWRTDLLPTEGARATLAIWHRDYAYTFVEELPFADLYAGKARLVLPQGGVLQGAVLLPGGEPAVGARVSLGLPGQMGNAMTQTDTDGRFILPGRWSGKTKVIIQADGCAPKMVFLDVVPGMPDAVIRLGSGHTIRGRVVGPDGAPIAGVEVGVTSWHQQPGALSWQAQTKADGRFVWSGAPEDSLRFGFRKEGYLAIGDRDLTPGPAEHEVLLVPPVTVTGTVTDAATGEPVTSGLVIPGLGFQERQGEVAIHSLQWFRPFAVAVGRGGRYEYRLDLACSCYQLKAEAPGYVSAISPECQPKDGAMTVHFRLHKAGNISGVVRLPDGSPAKDAEVYLVPADGSLNLAFPDQAKRMVPFVETGEDGVYRFPAEAGNWLLVASHRVGYAEAPFTVHGKDPDLHLEAWGRIEGVCLIGDGRQRVRSVNASPQSRWDIPGEPSRAPSVSHRTFAEPDAEGRFAIGGVPPGRVLVGPLIRLTPNSWGRSHLQYAEVKPGETTRIRIGGTGRPVIGHLALPQGVPIVPQWGFASIEIDSVCRLDVRRPVLPKTWDRLPSRERLPRIATWLETPEGRAYSDAKQAYAVALWQGRAKLTDNQRFIGMVTEDGSFRAEDILAGEYTLSATLHDPEASPVASKPLATVVYHFTVPPMEDGRSSTPLELGTIMLELPDE